MEKLQKWINSTLLHFLIRFQNWENRLKYFEIGVIYLFGLYSSSCLLLQIILDQLINTNLSRLPAMNVRESILGIAHMGVGHLSVSVALAFLTTREFPLPVHMIWLDLNFSFNILSQTNSLYLLDDECKLNESAVDTLPCAWYCPTQSYLWISNQMRRQSMIELRDLRNLNEIQNEGKSN